MLYVGPALAEGRLSFEASLASFDVASARFPAERIPLPAPTDPENEPADGSEYLADIDVTRQFCFPSPSVGFSERCDLIKYFSSTYEAHVKAAFPQKKLRIIIEKDLFFAIAANYKYHFVISIGKNFIFSKEYTTKEVSALLCHEIGHVLGERQTNIDPFYTTIRRPLALAVEGEADYFAAERCMPIILKEYGPIQPPHGPAIIDARCALKYKDEKQRNLCVITVNTFYNILLKSSETVNPDMPSLDVRNRAQGTNPVQNSGQCRFDTYFNGALGLPRPACWYAE